MFYSPALQCDSLPSAMTKPLESAYDDSKKESSDADGADLLTLPKLNMEVIATAGAQRPPDSFFNTDFTSTESTQDLLVEAHRVAPLQPTPRRHGNEADVGVAEKELALAALHDWHACVARSSALSVQLCEALRLVLEPTRASRMKGDFRTGKRLNMRKVGSEKRLIDYLMHACLG